MMKARFAILCLALRLTAYGGGQDAREPFTDAQRHTLSKPLPQG